MTPEASTPATTPPALSGLVRGTRQSAWRLSAVTIVAVPLAFAALGTIGVDRAFAQAPASPRPPRPPRRLPLCPTPRRTATGAPVPAVAFGRARRLERSARRLEGRPARRRHRRAEHGAACRACRSRPASSIRRSPPATRRRPSADPTLPEDRGRDAQRREAGDERRRSRPRATAKPAAPRPDRGGGLSFANSDLAFSGNHLVVGNFHGFNTYDIENAEEAEAGGVDGLPRRPGRRVDLRQPAVHVGRADARPRRLRHAGREPTR